MSRTHMLHSCPRSGNDATASFFYKADDNSLVSESRTDKYIIVGCDKTTVTSIFYLLWLTDRAIDFSLRCVSRFEDTKRAVVLQLSSRKLFRW